MKRRRAVKTMIYYSIGTGILFSCTDPFSAVKKLNLQNLKFDNNQLKIVDELSRIILPIQTIDPFSEHTTLPFVMKSVNDLYNPTKRAIFQKGIDDFNEFFDRIFAKSWNDGSIDEKSQLIYQLNEMEAKPYEKIQASKDIIKFFYDTVKTENLMYLKNCEYIQRNMRFYEMTPDRYDGAFLLEKKLQFHQ